jgi:aspartate-semialdehyde dehydrogenase
MEYNIAICGATGVVGRTVLKILEQKNLSGHNYTLFASKKSKGKKLKIADITYRVKELCLQNLEQTKFLHLII